MLECGRRAGVVHEQVGRCRSEPVESKVPPLRVRVCGEVRHRREVDQLELEEGLVQHQRGEELRLGGGGTVIAGELVRDEPL